MYKGEREREREREREEREREKERERERMNTHHLGSDYDFLPRHWMMVGT